MKVELKRLNNEFLMEAKGASGVPVLMDNSRTGQAEGASPMELLMMGVGGCSAIDIIAILKKQKQEIKDYRVEIEGERKDLKDVKPFKSIALKIYLEGDLAPEKVKRAATLSFEKYCSVSFSLDKSIEVTYQVYVNNQLIN